MDADVRSGEVLRHARSRAGLSQRALARRAGVTQSVISAYEQGRREPSLATLRRLVGATGMRLQVDVVRETDSGVAATERPPLRAVVEHHRQQVLEVLGHQGIVTARLFGSAARGDDGPDSDVDLLVDLPPGLGLFALARMRRELEELLGVAVDLVPEDGLKPHLRTRVLAEAVDL